MPKSSVEKDILDEIQKLGEEQQRNVLEFIRVLAKERPRGIPGKDLLRFAGTIDKDDLQKIAQAIDTGCERVDSNDWIISGSRLRCDLPSPNPPCGFVSREAVRRHQHKKGAGDEDQSNIRTQR